MRLRYVARISPRVTGFDAAHIGDDVSFLSLDKIWSDGRFDPSETVEFTGDLGSYNAVNEGDILLPKVSPTFAHGRCAIARGLIGGRALATSEVFVIRAHDPRDTRFLRYRLLAPDFLAAGQAAWTGVAGLKRVSAEFVANTPIQPAVWKHRYAIADFLDREWERIARAVAPLEECSGRLAGMERAIADAVVRHERTVPLKAVARIHSGVTLNESSIPPDAVLRPYLRVANVKAGWLDLRDVREVFVAPSKATTAKLRSGDLLLTEGGDLDKLGRGALWEDQLPDCLFQNHVFAVRCHAERALPAFLAWATRSSSARSYFEATASRITNLASTNRAKLGRWPVPDLPISEQRRRIAIADAAWRKAMAAADSAARMKSVLSEYRDSLIHEAVTGKLDVTRVSETEMDERLHAASEGRLDEVMA